MPPGTYYAFGYIVAYATQRPLFSDPPDSLDAQPDLAASDAKWTTGPTEKSFLEAWWLRKFPDNPLKWGSVLSLADAEELLIEFRNSTQAT